MKDEEIIESLRQDMHHDSVAWCMTYALMEKTSRYLSYDQDKIRLVEQLLDSNISYESLTDKERERISNDGEDVLSSISRHVLNRIDSIDFYLTAKGNHPITKGEVDEKKLQMLEKQYTDYTKDGVLSVDELLNFYQTQMSDNEFSISDVISSLLAEVNDTPEYKHGIKDIKKDLCFKGYGYISYYP